MRHVTLRSESGQSSMVEITATLLLLSIVMTFVYTSVDARGRATVLTERHRTAFLGLVTGLAQA